MFWVAHNLNHTDFKVLTYYLETFFKNQIKIPFGSKIVAELLFIILWHKQCVSLENPMKASNFGMNCFAILFSNNLKHRLKQGKSCMPQNSLKPKENVSQYSTGSARLDPACCMVNWSIVQGGRSKSGQRILWKTGGKKIYF